MFECDTLNFPLLNSVFIGRLQTKKITYSKTTNCMLYIKHLTYNAEESLPTLCVKDISYAMTFKYQVLFPNVFTPIKKNIDLFSDSSSSDERCINNFGKH